MLRRPRKAVDCLDTLATVEDLAADIDRLARERGLHGVVAVAGFEGGDILRAYGLAHRALRGPNTLETQFAIASGTKGFTALAVMSLVEQGVLHLNTRARSLLGSDLPLVDDEVTIEHLLAHRSGIGDYLDESLDTQITDYVLSVPLHTLAETEALLSVIDGYPQVFPPGERFAYNNGGFVLLALLAERASGVPFHDLVAERVCDPAGLTHTGFLRSDELPGTAALGYLAEDHDRTNVLHLPVRGSGDGGIYSTVADLARFWDALFAGRIVSDATVAAMTAPRSDVPQERKRYGLGFWLHATTSAVILEGYDAGVSFRSTHDPVTGRTATVIANTSEGAWPLVARLQSLFD
jgi:CubicO group peptidase (beta-lactamase class C family)